MTNMETIINEKWVGYIIHICPSVKGLLLKTLVSMYQALFQFGSNVVLQLLLENAGSLLLFGCCKANKVRKVAFHLLRCCYGTPYNSIQSDRYACVCNIICQKMGHSKLHKNKILRLSQQCTAVGLTQPKNKLRKVAFHLPQ